jgi:hypothetical protein
LPILGRFFGAVKITFLKKIGKIHQHSYFGTIYSKKKRKPRSIKGIIRQVQAIIIYFYKDFQKIIVFRFFVADHENIRNQQLTNLIIEQLIGDYFLSVLHQYKTVFVVYGFIGSKICFYNISEPKQSIRGSERVTVL